MRDTNIRMSAAGRVRLVATLALATVTIALLSLVPTVQAQAQAQASAPTITLPPTGEVEAALGKTPLGALPAEKLAEVLSQLKDLEGGGPGNVQEALEKLIAELTGKGATLEELLHGNPQGKLGEILASTGVSEVIGKLLAGTPEPQQLIAEILAALNPEQLQKLLGSVLAGEAFVKSTVEELARRLGTSAETLASQFGKTAEQLPGTAMALTAPLRDGETLGVLGGAGGMTLGLIKGAGETTGLTGGTGGPGGNGTVTIATAAPAARPTPAPTPASGVKGFTTGKLRVVSHKVKGRSATVVVEVPSAGTLSAGGKGLRSIKRETAKAERVTLHPSLTKARTSALRKHPRRKLKVPMKVSFKEVSGATSSVTVALTYG